MSAPIKLDHLRAELADAFAQRPCPPEGAIFNLPLSDEGYEAKQWLSGRTWQEIVEDGVGQEQEFFSSSLAPAGWCYYFPALALLALDPDDPADLEGAMLARLLLSSETLIPLLSLPERLAVVHWIEYVRYVHQTRDQESYFFGMALERYWYPAVAKAECREMTHAKPD